MSEKVWNSPLSAEFCKINANDRPVLLMISGGSDSTAMCLLAAELANKGQLDRSKTLVLHVDHGLRGKDSDEDVLFVERLSKLCDFDFECRRIDIQSRLAEFDNNIENTARHMRYELANSLLDSLCKRCKIDSDKAEIWTAHTIDDRVETFFMRAIVGTGPGGLASIQRRSARVFRPLLSFSREELREYIQQRVEFLGWELDPPKRAQVQGGLWREDATNADTKAFRSFVRHEVVPVLLTRNPSLFKTLEKTMDLIGDENTFMEGLSLEAADKFLHRLPTGVLALDAKEVKDLEPVVVKRLIYRICREIMPINERIDRAHIDEIFLGIGQAGFGVDIPGGINVHEESGWLLFGESDYGTAQGIASKFSKILSAGIALEFPGSINIELADLQSLSISAEVIEVSSDADPVEMARSLSSKWTICCDLEKVEASCKRSCIASPQAPCLQVPAPQVPNSQTPQNSTAKAALIVSSRKTGDRLKPAGMGGRSRKLSDVLVDRKIPRSLRDLVIILRAGDQILWVAGIMSCEPFLVEASTQSLLKISVSGALYL